MTNKLPFQPDLSCKPVVLPFFDEGTFTYTYVVKDPQSKACAIIDSVMEFDYSAGATRYEGADRVIQYIQDNHLELQWILETHVHADHLTAAPYIQAKLGGKQAIGKHIVQVQEVFGRIFNEGADFKRDGSQFDRMLDDGDQLTIGSMTLFALHTPGHTPACMSFVIGDAVFIGDTLFMPDSGTARADFPGGDAHQLYQSIQRLFLLPDSMRVFMCHDYGEGRPNLFESTIAEEKKLNIHVNSGVSEATFVAMRKARDATLAVPRLIFPSLQVNMRAGHLPEAENNGRVYFKLPINLWAD